MAQEDIANKLSKGIAEAFGFRIYCKVPENMF